MRQVIIKFEGIPASGKSQLLKIVDSFLTSDPTITTKQTAEHELTVTFHDERLEKSWIKHEQTNP